MNQLPNFDDDLVDDFEINQESIPQVYDDHCATIVKKLIKLNGELFLFRSNKALFVPISIFDDIKMEIQNLGIYIEDNHIWDYDLKIGDKYEPMKLIWIMQHDGSPIPIHRKIKYAFNFLQPDYLQYMHKPFWNPDVLTQVNLILAYHRDQKRRRGIEIFNICDLIKFKMAIDDNRIEYVNCEFHKIIDSSLREMIQSGMYMKGTKFDLNLYLGDKYVFRNVQEIFEYLVYHFQQTICSLYWSAYHLYNVKLSNIANVPEFIENLHKSDTMLIRETDASGKCSEVLYEILTKSKNFINLKFQLDGEWIYNGNDDRLNKINKSLARCEISIDSKNSFNFIENFINWLQLAFGVHSKYFVELRLKMFETISPYVFNGLHLKELEIRDVQLDYKIIRMLTQSTIDIIYFINCRIANDMNERFEFIGRPSKIDKNIFKIFDELHNVGFIQLELEEHTIGILFAHVASIMMENKLTEFQLINQMWIPNEYKILFIRTELNSEMGQIEGYSRRTGDKINFYELLNQLDLTPSDRDEFDFYT